jgi:transcriptional regulator with XRE-family HTH domain
MFAARATFRAKSLLYTRPTVKTRKAEVFDGLSGTLAMVYCHGMGEEKQNQRLGAAIRRARQAQEWSQAALAERLQVAQPTVSGWERGRGLTKANVQKIEAVLGNLTTDGESTTTMVPGDFGLWLRETRGQKGLSVPQLAETAQVSAPTIYNIESGRSRRIQEKTQKKLVKALGERLPQSVSADDKWEEEEDDVPGIGAMISFDPHDEVNLPTKAGIYVLYDISERPIYIGQSRRINKRIRDHSDKFWFKRPIVDNAAYIEIQDENLRVQVERILINFLKSNAVINIQHVNR